MLPGTRAELIDGIVDMPSPVGLVHGMAQVPVIVWLDYYARKPPECKSWTTPRRSWAGRASRNLTGCSASCLNAAVGRGTRVGSCTVVRRLFVEVAKATRYVDLGPKLADYQQAGILEYVVHAMDPDEIFWFGQERACWCNDRSAAMACTVRPPFQDCGSICKHFSRATSSGCVPCSTSAAPRPNTPRSSADWPWPEALCSARRAAVRRGPPWTTRHSVGSTTWATPFNISTAWTSTWPAASM